MATETASVAPSGPNPLDWTSEQRQRLGLAQRYKNTAERTFHRSWAILRTLREDKTHEELAEAKRKQFSEECWEPPQFVIVVEDTEDAKSQDSKKPDPEIMSRSQFEALEEAQKELGARTG